MDADQTGCIRRRGARASFRVLGWIVLMLGVAAAVHAYTPDPRDPDYLDANANVFLQDEVTRVDVTMSEADFQTCLADPYSDVLRTVTARWRNSRIDETYTDVGFRPRGGSFTRPVARKSWKLDFNSLVPGREFHGLEKVNLNGDHNDATFLRRMAAHAVGRRMGLPMPRTHFVALYITTESRIEEFQSIQVHAEMIDEEFAGSWFGNKDGNLYKCLYGSAPADLAYRPAEDYQTLGGGNTYFEGNNEPASDYTDLKQFIAFFNNSPNATVYSGLEHYLNVDNFLRYLALDVAVGSWDDYWYGSNNFYLYFNQGTQRFEWIPYDYDNTLGMDFFGQEWATRHFDGWGDGGFGTTPAPLVDEVFNNSEWRRQYRMYLSEAVDILADPAIAAQIDAWHDLIYPYFEGPIEFGGRVGRQPSSGEYGDWFVTGKDQPVSWDGTNFHSQGLKPYMAERSATLASQVGAYSTPALPLLTINEVLASNGTIVQDEAGQFEDWIELYNDGTSPVDVGGMFLSDDVTSPTKWMIPPGTMIGAKGFLLVWADNDPLDGPLHAAYQLDLQGETIGLFHNEANGRVLIDYLTYPALITDVSFGRYTDGTDNLTSFTVVTPAAMNDNTGGGGGEPRDPPRLFINEFMAQNT
ncbi:CotH kinase family protein, partial [Candidatus Poribacteria bacterium]|nr:CotH kinase family protein [Candidatus Poribacteria bacterium]